MYYNVPVTVSKQEDGLWRAEAPGIQACWVDAETLEQALADIHEVIVMAFDLDLGDPGDLPAGIVRSEALPFTVTVPVNPAEHHIKRYPVRAAKAKRVRPATTRR